MVDGVNNSESKVNNVVNAVAVFRALHSRIAVTTG